MKNCSLQINSHIKVALKVKGQENFKNINFLMQTVIKYTKRIIPAEFATKKLCPFISYVYLFNAFKF